MTDPNPAPFQNFDPNAGLSPNLVPSPPPAMPAPQDLPDPSAHNYPFSEPQDVESIIAQSTIERPLPLFIPPELKHKGMEYHIINDTPQELAAAMRRGWQLVTNQDLVKLFEGKVSGSDKTGKITKPLLVARDRRIGAHEAKLKRQKLAEQNKGLDPKSRSFNSSRAENITVGPDASKGDFSGIGLGRIRV